MGDVLIPFAILLVMFSAVVWKDRRRRPRAAMTVVTNAVAAHLEQGIEVSRICICSYCPQFDGKRCLLSTTGSKLISWEACKEYRETQTMD